MKRLLPLLALACTPAAPPPTGASAAIEKRLTLPEGAALAPDDPAHPGEAAPGPLAVAHGKLFVALQNLDHYAPAGPSFLAIVNPATLEEEKLANLAPCRDATSLLALEDTLLVACAGSVALPPAVTDDGLLVEVGLDGTVQRRVAVGHSPGGLARVGDDVWMGDGEGGGLSHVAYERFAARGMVQACATGPTKSGFASDVATWEGRLFAACFNDDALQELDPVTGARIGEPIPTGAGPLRLASLGHSLFVLDDLGGTLTVVHPGPPLTTDRAAIYLGRDGEQGGNDPQGIAGDEGRVGVTNSAYGTFVVVDLRASKVVASVDLKPAPDAPSNFPTHVATDGTAFFVSIPGLEADTRNVPSELVRIGVEL